MCNIISNVNSLNWLQWRSKLYLWYYSNTLKRFTRTHYRFKSLCVYAQYILYGWGAIGWAEIFIMSDKKKLELLCRLFTFYHHFLRQNTKPCWGPVSTNNHRTLCPSGLSKFSGIPLVPGLVWSRVDESGGKWIGPAFYVNFDSPPPVKWPKVPFFLIDLIKLFFHI